MATTDQNITELPIKTASEVSDADYLMGIDLVEGYQVLTKDFADYVVNEAEITVGGKKQTTANAISEIGTTASNAQPKESGKGLSTNDYTTAEKNKLSGIASGAEVNVNADWNATSGDAQILHKPTTVEGYGITDAYTKTEVDEITDTSESESDDSNPITIVTDSAQIAKNTHLTFEPIQDLHSYDHPWPAGGGKNKLNIQTVGVGSSQLTVDINNKNQNYLVINGTSSSSNDYVDLNSNIVFSNADIVAGETYIYEITGSFPSGSITSSYINKRSTSSGSASSYPSTYISPTKRSFVAPTADGSMVLYFGFSFNQNTSFNNARIEISVYKASESYTFEPYSNICQISGLDSVEVKRTGKNLFDPNAMSAPDVTISDGKITLTAGTANIRFRNGIPLNFPKDKQLTLSMDLQSDLNAGNSYSVGLLVGFSYSDGTKNEIYALNNTTNAQHITLNSISGKTIKSIYATFGSFGNNIWNITNLQLELGSTATEYEPYAEQIITESLPTTVYGGTLDLETGELVVDRVRETFTSSLIAAATEGTSFFAQIKTGIKRNGDNSVSANIKASYLKTNPANDILSKEENQIAVNTNGTVNIKIVGLTSKDEYDTYLSNNPLQVVYELATPITYTLTPKQLDTVRGINHISTNAKSVKVTFRAGQLATLEDVASAVKIADEHLEEKITDVLNVLAPLENGTTASKAYTTGQYFMHNGQFCRAKTNIASGATFTLNTNYEVTTVGAELYTALHS